MFPRESDDPAVFEKDKMQVGGRKRARKSSSGIQIGENNESNKSVHREIERQRRHEMAGLYASLRSLLPLHYVKGKRAIADHMHQAVVYIKDIQNKIEQLKHKLKTMSSTQNSKEYCVRVNLFRDGVLEILIRSELKEETFPLSKVLADLLAKGLNVTTCLSTRGDGYSLHKLQIQLDETSIDVSQLQDRLINLIKLPV